MGNVLNFVSPIPFYDSLLEINSKKDYVFGQTYKNVLYYDGRFLKIPSFVIHTLFSFDSVVQYGVTLFKHNTGLEQISSIVTGINDNGYLTLFCYASDYEVQGLDLGEYYFVAYIFDGEREYKLFSDYFYLTNDIHNYIKLSWKNSVDLHINNRVIPFEEGFEPYCYVDALIGKPSYEYEEEITSRLGYDFVEMQLSKKTYRFGFVAPEYLCDALRIMKVCDTKQITRYDFQNYGRLYSLMNMGFEVDWQDHGDLAGITITFNIDSVVSNTSGYLPLGGDFNNDYNSDFNNG